MCRYNYNSNTSNLNSGEKLATVTISLLWFIEVKKNYLPRFLNLLLSLSKSQQAGP